jgi:hypothetical protein
MNRIELITAAALAAAAAFIVAGPHEVVRVGC